METTASETLKKETFSTNRGLFIFAIFAAISIVLLIGMNFKSNRDISDLKYAYQVAQDSLVVTYNALKQQSSKIEVLTAENSFIVTELTVKDKEITRLQNVIKTYEKQKGDLNTALILTTETVTHLQDSIQNIIVSYTTVIETLNDSLSTNIIYPTYSRDFEDRWKKGMVTMGLKELDFYVKTKNEYDITIGEERVNLFKKKVFANITNLNPNTETTVMKVYQKEPIKTHTIRNVGIGAVIGAIGALLIN